MPRETADNQDEYAFLEIADLGAVLLVVYHMGGRLLPKSGSAMKLAGVSL